MADETSALVDFLRTQLDTDEQVTRACLAEVGNGRKGEPWLDDPDEVRDRDDYPSYPSCGPAELAYMEATHPAVRLVEIEANRRILDEVARIPGDGINYTLSEQNRAEWILQALALPYADREGYRPEWRPA